MKSPPLRGFYPRPNGGAACSNCTLGPNSVTTGPAFVSPALGDYRLQEGSPAIDRGADVGFDVNGAAAGTFNGDAPDIGYWESP